MKIMFIVLFLMAGNDTRAAFFDFENKQKVIKVGDIVQVSLYVVPDENIVSVANLELSYPRNKLWAKSFNLAPEWLAVPGDEFSFIDNTSGRLKKSAGYIGSVKSRILFGVANFVAIDGGPIEINVGENSFIYDPNNQDVLKKRTSIMVEIGDMPSSEAPNQLFDIRLELGNSSVFNTKELITKVIFENFGKVQAPVDMIFTVTDSKGRILATSRESVIVETQAVYNKKFDDLNLPSGSYAIKLSTRYNADVVDDFSAEFQIVSQREVERPVLIALLVVGVTAIYFIYRRKVASKTKTTARQNNKANYYAPR